MSKKILSILQEDLNIPTLSLPPHATLYAPIQGQKSPLHLQISYPIHYLLFMGLTFFYIFLYFSIFFYIFFIYFYILSIGLGAQRRPETRPALEPPKSSIYHPPQSSNIPSQKKSTPSTSKNKKNTKKPINPIHSTLHRKKRPCVDYVYIEIYFL